MAVSENCEKCKVDMGFPSAREVLEKKRACPACGHTQRVEKSILYVVETLEERHEWLDERLQVIEAQLGITARIKPQPVPPKRPVIQEPAKNWNETIQSDEFKALERPVPTAPPVDLFADVLPTQCHVDDVVVEVPQILKDYLETAPKLGTRPATGLPDII